MDKLENILGRITERQNAIDGMGPFTDAVRKKIDYKLRLDWNYYSNRMEGGTLTREETRSVMVGNIDVQGKPLKDIIEMRGHDKAVLDILKLGKGELRLSEKRIKALHALIMFEDEDTPHAQIGQWKTTPNEIINYRNEKIAFAQPAEVPEQMHHLLNHLNTHLDAINSGNTATHPAQLAADFHLQFVTIHPFYDGNGRMARILTNLILVSLGLPPIIIKENQKQAYYRYLADVQAYGGNPHLFYAFISERVFETQELVLKAFAGEEIDEPDDLDKKLALLEKELAADESENVKAVTLTPHVAAAIMRDWAFDLAKDLKEISDKFNRFYVNHNHQLFIQIGNQAFHEWTDNMAKFLERLESQDLEKFNKGPFQFQYYSEHKGYTHGGLQGFDCTKNFLLKFHPLYYQINFQGVNEDFNIKKALNDPPTPRELQLIQKAWGDSLLHDLEQHRNQLKNKP